MGFNVFELLAKISLDTSEYDSNLTNAGEQTNAVFTAMKASGEKLSSIGSTLTQHVSMPLLEFGKQTLETASNFQAGMSEVQAISGATGDEMERLKETGLSMASQTKFSTAEVAEAYKYMGMAGWDAGQMIDGLAGVMYLAGASGEDLATTSDIVTDALTAFNMPASDAGMFANVLAAASSNANTNVGMMGESFKYVAPLAGSLNYSIQDVALALGLMANTGIKAGSAGAQLRNILTNLANPTETMQWAMEALGVSLEDSEGNMYSLKEVMDQLRKGFGEGHLSAEEFSEGMSNLQTQLEEGEITSAQYEDEVNKLAIAMYGAEGAQKAEIASMLAGKESMAGLLAIVGAAPEDYDKLTAAVYNSNGAAEDMYTIMNDNANGAVTMLMSAIDVLAESLGEFLIPAFTGVVKKVTEIVNWFNSLDDGTKKVILGILGVVAVVGPLLSGLGGILSGVAAVGPAVAALGGAFTFLTSPIGLVIAGVTALVGALVWAYNTFEGFRNFVNGIGEAIGNFWDWITGKQDESLDHMESSLTSANSKMEQSTTQTWSSIESQMGNSLDTMVNIADTATNSIGTSVDSTWTAANASTASNWGSMENQVVSSLDQMGSSTETTTANMSEWIDSSWTGASASTETNWGGMEEQVLGSLGSMSAETESATGNISTYIDASWASASASTDQNWLAMVNTTDTKSGEAVSAVEQNFDKIEGTVATQLDKARNSAMNQNWSGVGVNIVDGISGGVRDRADDLANSVANAALSALNAAKTALAINSPSKKFRDIIGLGIDEGIAVGVEENQDLVSDSVNGMAKNIQHSFDSSMMPFELGKVSTSFATTAYSRNENELSRGVFGQTVPTTVIINSPVAVDGVKAAKEWKKTAQQVAMGFM